jgi:hypothetical protein
MSNGLKRRPDAQVDSTNGHNGNLNEDSLPTSSLKSQSTSSNGLNRGPVLKLQLSLFEMGRERAISSGVLKAREADLSSLRELAHAMASETRRELYNPTTKEQHRLRESEYQKLLVDRVDAEDAVNFSAAEVRAKEEQLAAIPAPEKPAPSMPLVWALVAGVAGTIVSTIHDFLFVTVDDVVLAWLFALACAVFLAGVIVWSILGSISATGRRTTANWAGLIAGFIISAGLGLLRWSGASEDEEKILAIALTVLEVGLIVIAEWVASGLRDHFREWIPQQAAYDKAKGALAAAQDELGRRQDRLAQINNAVKAHIEYVEDLDLRNVNLNELVSAAVKAVIDGYNEGLAINRGRVIKAGGAR